MHRTHRSETIVAGGRGQQTKAQQQGEARKARHDDIHEASVRVAGLAMVRHHQRPGGQRHQFPGEQEAERVGCHHDQVQPGEERRIERQHTLRLGFVAAVTERVEAGAGTAQSHDRKEERGQRIKSEIRADPRQAEGQCHC